MLISGDRLGNKALSTNMKLLEKLCGGRAVWKNIIIVITRRDYNEMIFSDEEEWEESLTDIEAECKELIQDTFEDQPYGCVALSLQFPKSIKKPMEPVVEKVMLEKFAVIKQLAISSEGFETKNIS